MEHRIWLTGYGFGLGFLSVWLSAGGRRLLMVRDEAKTVDGVVGEVTRVLTSLCAGLSVRWSAARQAMEAVAVVIPGGQP